MALAVGQHYRLRDGSTGAVCATYTDTQTFFSGSVAGDCLVTWKPDGTCYQTQSYDIMTEISAAQSLSAVDHLATAMLLYPGRLDGYGASPWAWRDRQGYSGPIFGVIHGTADPGADARGVFNWFMGPNAGNCSHFVIGKVGEIFQLADPNWASAANCCPSSPSPFQTYFPNGANANYGTTSFELLKNGVNNEDTPTDAQYAALIAVARWVTKINAIKPVWASDGSGGWTSHSFLDPVHRPNNSCPGTFDWKRFFAGLQTKVVNPHMDQALLDCWNSNGLNLPYTTGIALEWQALAQGVSSASPGVSRQVGPALGAEYTSVDWSGSAIQVQEFPGARIEWYLSTSTSRVIFR